MKFSTVQEAFNHYRNSTLAEIEARATQIKTEINGDNADIDTLNIELDGLKEAKASIKEKEQKADSGTKETRSFNPITGMEFDSAAPMGDGDVCASREYRSAFSKFMLNQPLTTAESAIIARARQTLSAESRAAFINTSEAAAVIPTQMLDEIFKLATEEGAVLSLARRFDLPANVAVPVATPEDMAEWHVEGAEVTPTNKKPTNVIFHGYELMKVFSISAAARAMSISAYENYLQQELSRVMVTALQYAAVHGTGVGQPLGLLADGVITKVLEEQTKGYTTFAKALGALKRGYSMGAVWVMNNTTLYESVVGIVDANGRPLFNEARDGATDRILGKPVVVDDFIPDNVVLLGNFKYYAMNYPQNIMLEVSRDSSFRKGLIDYRAMAVADGKPIVEEAFVKIELE